MSEDKTKPFASPDLLQQVLVKLEVLDARLQSVEAKLEKRGFDTKPIWERALAEIMAVNRRVTAIDLKIAVFSRDMLNLRADQLGFNERLNKLETESEENGSIRTIG